METKKPRGFAAMDPDRRREIARRAASRSLRASAPSRETPNWPRPPAVKAARPGGRSRSDADRAHLSMHTMQSSSTKQAALAAFGQRIRSLFHCAQDVKVICTAEQFTTFIVERDRLGGKNGIKELHLKLLTPPAHLTPTIDVSRERYV